MALDEKRLFLGLGYMPLCDRPHWDDFPNVMGIAPRRQHALYLRWQQRGWMPAGDLWISSTFTGRGWLEWIRLRPALEREILLLWRPRTGDSLQRVCGLRRMRLRIHQKGYRLPDPAEVTPAMVQWVDRAKWAGQGPLRALFAPKQQKSGTQP